MKIFSCREAGCECDYVAKVETEEEVMKDAAYHSIKEHGKEEEEEEEVNQMKEMIKALIRNS
jgi:predicted small metal-binding protein